MAPEEIVAEINGKNRSMLYARSDFENLTHEQVLRLMDAAAMQGFQFGSDVAMSAVKGLLLIKRTRVAGPKEASSACG